MVDKVVGASIKINTGSDGAMNGKSDEILRALRDIQKELKENGVQLATEADETTSGPASIVLIDPDGNGILIDQHV